MKMKHCSLILLCSTLFLISCSKDGSNGADGTNGTSGTNGTNGTNGANGTNGKDGKTALTRTTKEAAGANCKYGGTKFETGIDANNNGILDNSEVTTTQTQYVCDGAGATYSSWIDVNVVDTTFNNGVAQNFNHIQIIPAPTLTTDIVDKGIVLMYYRSKDSTVVPIERDGSYQFTDLDAAGTGTIYFRPGYVFKEKMISFLVNTYTGWNTYNRDELNKNGSAIRYVLIPGMTQGRSIADLKKMPYGELAKLYNIKN
jgi:hypothetical protein